ncbi:MAG: ABC transporter permease, partial [Actinomycetota bacterium]
MKESMQKSNSSLSFKNGISKVFGMRYIFIWIFLLVYVIFIIISPTYRSISPFLDILRISSIGALLYLGLTWIIAAGELDLSFTEIAAFVSVMFAYFMTKGISIWLSAIIALCLGILWGVVNGLFVGILGLPSLITTLAVGAAAKGIMTTIIAARPVRVITVGPVIDKIVFGTILGGLPILFIIVLVIYLIMRFIQDRTITGHYLYIIGENRIASKAAGINHKKIIFGVFILSAVFASFAGILLTGLYQTGNPDVGSYYLLE